MVFTKQCRNKQLAGNRKWQSVLTKLKNAVPKESKN
jgi:hypothetical protein